MVDRIPKRSLTKRAIIVTNPAAPDCNENREEDVEMGSAQFRWRPVKAATAATAATAAMFHQKTKKKDGSAGDRKMETIWTLD